ncbi:MAG: hypothetical protein AB8G99_13285 [Planctomycetaceae bacterium]
MKHLATLAALTVAILGSECQVACAQGADDIAAECVKVVRTTVARVNNALGDDVQRCVAAIEGHKANGDMAKARRVARRCIKRINRTTRAGHNSVREVCERCINALMDLGELELAGRLRNVCADALERIEDSGERARAAIRNALN